MPLIPLFIQAGVAVQLNVVVGKATLTVVSYAPRLEKSLGTAALNITTYFAAIQLNVLAPKASLSVTTYATTIQLNVLAPKASLTIVAATPLGPLVTIQKGPARAPALAIDSTNVYDLTVGRHQATARLTIQPMLPLMTIGDRWIREGAVPDGWVREEPLNLREAA